MSCINSVELQLTYIAMKGIRKRKSLLFTVLMAVTCYIVVQIAHNFEMGMLTVDLILIICRGVGAVRGPCDWNGGLTYGGFKHSGGGGVAPGRAGRRAGGG